MRAKKWLKRATSHGVKTRFSIFPEKDGGYAGSLVGLGFIERNEDEYTLTRKGELWIGSSNQIR